MKRISVLLVTLILSVSLTFGQNIRLNGAAGSHTIAGTVNVKGNIDNSTAGAGAFYTFSGTVDLTGTTAQYLAGNASTAGSEKIVFGTLTNTGGTAAKTLKKDIDVTTSLNVGGSGSFVVDANTLTITGTSAGTVLDASNGSGTVAYNSGSAQTILPATYAGTLALTAAGQKDVSATVAVSGTFSHAGGNLAVAGTGVLNYSGTAATLLGVSVAASGQMNNTGTGSLAITTLASNAGSINSSSSGTIVFTNSVVNDGTITTATGVLDFNGTVTNNATRSITVTGAGNASFFGDVTNSGTFTFANGSTATYDGTSSQAIASPSAGNYYNLTLSGNAAKTTSGNITLDNTFSNLGTTSLDMGTGSNSLTAVTYSQAAGATVRFGGTTHGRAIASGIVEYYGAAGSTIALGTYERLDLTGTGAAALAGNTITLADLNVGANSILTVGGGLTLNVGQDGSGDLVVDGSINNSGTITVGE